MLNRVRIAIILGAMVSAAILVGYVTAVDQSPPTGTLGGSAQISPMDAHVGSNYQFYGYATSGGGLIELFHVPAGHKFRLEDVVFTNYDTVVTGVSLGRGSAGTVAMLDAAAPPGGNFDHRFSIVLNSGERLEIAATGGTGIFYCISGTLL
jgi:hypothetical protein